MTMLLKFEIEKYRSLKQKPYPSSRLEINTGILKSFFQDAMYENKTLEKPCASLI